MVFCRRSIAFLLILALMAVVSCSGEKEKEPKKFEDVELGSAEEARVVSDKVSFGVYFDRDGEKNTIELPPEADQVRVYIIIKFPRDMEITAAEWRLDLPEGLVIESDKYLSDRNVSLGTFDYGISERFSCHAGPELVLHVLTMNVTKKLDNAKISILPSKKSHFLGVAECKEGFPLVRATSYIGVINPE